MGRRKTSDRQLDGLLVLNKPKGPSSAHCLEKVKRALGQPRIGHAGTLDPAAEGVLLVLLGQGTKLAPYLEDTDKTYRGSFILGLETDSYDLEGAVVREAPWQDVDPEQVRAEIASWTDLTEQEVPPVSAAKHQGKPLYALQRAGEEVPVKVKPIHLSLSEVLNIELPRGEFRISCARGTYVRSLVHSLGKRLGCGATLTGLIRERSGPFGLEVSHDLETVLSDPESFPSRVIRLGDMLPHWPRVVLSEADVLKVRNGMRLPTSLVGVEAAAFGRAMFQAPDSSALALAEVLPAAGGRGEWAVLRGLWAAQG